MALLPWLAACGGHAAVQSHPDASEVRDAGRVGADAGNTNEPDAGNTSEPDAGNTSEPDAGNTSEPDAGNTSEPDAGITSEPDAGNTSEPDAGNTSEPDAGNTSEPDAGNASEPDAGNTSEPDAGNTSGPDAGNTNEPDAGNTSGPDAGNTSEPDAGNTNEPDAGQTPALDGGEPDPAPPAPETLGLSCATAADCDDGNPCTVASCDLDAALGRRACVVAPRPLGALCSDGNACTVDDHCVEARCRGTARGCDGACDTGECDPATGCESVPDGTTCDDRDLFTTGDACTGGRCRGASECVPPQPAPCVAGVIDHVGGTCSAAYYAAGQACPDDGDPCTRDECDGLGTCVHPGRGQGAACSHGCGPGICAADGACVLATSECGRLDNACGQGGCDGDACVYDSGDDAACDETGTNCAASLGACFTGGCGDGWCTGGEQEFNCTADCSSPCEFDCLESCAKTYRAFPWRGAWRAAQSAAYGFPLHSRFQTQSFTQMLQDGIRWLHLVVDYCQPGVSSGPICLCRGDDTCPAASTPLDGRLTEVRAFLEARPGAVVTLYFERAFVSDDDLKAAIDRAGLARWLYRDRPTYDERFDVRLATMARHDRRLVVIGGPYISLRHVFLTNDGPPVAAGAGPSRGPSSIFVLNADNEPPWDCERAGLGPFDPPYDQDPPGRLFAVRHTLEGRDSSVETDRVSTACFNGRLAEHSDACVERHPGVAPLTVALTAYYDSHPDALKPVVHLARSTRIVRCGSNVASPLSQCPEDVATCSSDAACPQGATCNWLGVCVDCVADGDCADGQYCHDAWSACLTRLPDGDYCSRDTMCASGNCGLLCYSCSTHADCDEGEWCDVFGGCQVKVANAYGCLSDAECLSGACHLGFCAACNSQDDCTVEGRFCSLDPAPGASACLARKADGALCANDFECGSGACHLGTCQPCNSHDDCAALEYCTLPVVPGLASTCEAAQGEGGACLGSAECTSPLTCHASGTCRASCSLDTHCPATHFCVLGGCVPRLDLGAACTRNRICSSDRCWLGFCVECASQADCQSDSFCTLDPVPGQSSCVAKKAFGTLCASAYECTSNRCDVTCVDCTAAPAAGCTFSTQYCEFGLCNAKKATGQSCATSNQCTSGICDLFKCVQCTNVPQTGCNFSTQYCSAGACNPKKSNGQSCGTSAECSSGICDLFKCVQCTNVPQNGCNFSTQYCSAGACYSKKSNGQTCGASAECTSGICDLFKCVQCTNVPQSGCNFSTQFCNGGACYARKSNGSSCSTSSECSSGICDLFKCVQCNASSGCTSTQYCEAGTCYAERSNGSDCAFSNQCQSGICDLFKCVQCNAWGGCTSSQYCETGSCQAKKGSGSSCGSSDQCTSNDCFLWTCR
ncbi:MAG: hypothetical protein HY904_23775 [Deltaproteobacteria bacterium]|nr:hypothetical protein [Deltaproteobacteria bacterium]